MHLKNSRADGMLGDEGSWTETSLSVTERAGSGVNKGRSYTREVKVCDRSDLTTDLLQCLYRRPGSQEVSSVWRRTHAAQPRWCRPSPTTAVPTAPSQSSLSTKTCTLHLHLKKISKTGRVWEAVLVLFTETEIMLKIRDARYYQTDIGIGRLNVNIGPIWNIVPIMITHMCSGCASD